MISHQRPKVLYTVSTWGPSAGCVHRCVYVLSSSKGMMLGKARQPLYSSSQLLDPHQPQLLTCLYTRGLLKSISPYLGSENTEILGALPNSLPWIVTSPADLEGIMVLTLINLGHLFN